MGLVRTDDGGVRIHPPFWDMNVGVRAPIVATIHVVKRVGESEPASALTTVHSRALDIATETDEALDPVTEG